MCSSHATVRGLLHEIPADDFVVVVDNEASPEHLSRATPEAVDLMLVVAEPYFKSLETARRYYAMGKDLGIPNIGVIANKVRDDDDRAAMRDFCERAGLELLSYVPQDETLGRAERAGAAPVDFDADAPAVLAIEDVARYVADASRVGAKG